LILKQSHFSAYRYVELTLNTVLEDHADNLALGEFLVVTPGQIRIAGRPRA
jgi:hypothetical protein